MIVFGVLRHVRREMRGAVELRELGELSTRETAGLMGLSVAAIKARVFHARKELGKALRYCAVSLEGRSGAQVGIEPRGLLIVNSLSCHHTSFTSSLSHAH